MSLPEINLGLSPCPNDTFIFHALLHGLSSPDLTARLKLRPHMADVEELNRMALEGRLEISKMSLGVLPKALEKYRIFTSGAALGWGVGPLLVSRYPLSESMRTRATIAIPGRMTTANLLLDLHGGFRGPRREMLFSDIIPAVAAGEVDAGLIIHEGRFTWEQWKLCKLLDLGQWWEAEYAMPLPLGVIAVRRDLDMELASEFERAIAQSLSHAWGNPEASWEYVRAHAQEMDRGVIRSHIDTFVTEYSLNLGNTGKSAIARLLSAAGSTVGEDIFLN